MQQARGRQANFKGACSAVLLLPALGRRSQGLRFGVEAVCEQAHGYPFGGERREVS